MKHNTISVQEAESRYTQMDGETQEQTAIIFLTTVKGMTESEAIDHYKMDDDDYDQTESEEFFQWYASRLEGTESESDNRISTMRTFKVIVQIDEADEDKIREHFIGANADDSLADIITMSIESNSNDMMIVESIEEVIPTIFNHPEMQDEIDNDIFSQLTPNSTATNTIDKDHTPSGMENYILEINDENEDEILIHLNYETREDAEQDVAKLMEL